MQKQIPFGMRTKEKQIPFGNDNQNDCNVSLAHLLGDGQAEGEDGAVVGLAGDGDAAVVRFDDGAADGEAHAGA